jgi:Ser/Thr protein kinase RdoA (MazF antagonist)
VPACLGFREDLQLVVFGEIAGVPRVAQLLREGSRGESSPDGLTLDNAVEACGRVAARLHTSGLRLGDARPLDLEIATLREGLGPVRRMSPDVAEQLDQWLDVARRRATATAELEPALCHGDFSYTQLIFDGPHAGLVDFDNVCQAEPALDLGQFLAYLHYAGVKARRATGTEPGDTERLADLFRAAYTRAGGPPAALERVEVYLATNLVRMAEHAWQNLKSRRLEDILWLLSERLPR